MAVKIISFQVRLQTVFATSHNKIVNWQKLTVNWNFIDLFSMPTDEQANCRIFLWD